MKGSNHPTSLRLRFIVRAECVACEDGSLHAVNIREKEVLTLGADVPEPIHREARRPWGGSAPEDEQRAKNWCSEGAESRPGKEADHCTQHTNHSYMHTASIFLNTKEQQ